MSCTGQCIQALESLVPPLVVSAKTWWLTHYVQSSIETFRRWLIFSKLCATKKSANFGRIRGRVTTAETVTWVSRVNYLVIFRVKTLNQCLTQPQLWQSRESIIWIELQKNDNVFMEPLIGLVTFWLFSDNTDPLGWIRWADHHRERST